LKATDHPNIVKIKDSFGNGENGSVLVFEFLSGADMTKTAAEHFKNGVPQETALDWMI